MQDGWGDKDVSVVASRHSSWEDEEEGGGMWNSAGSQGSGSSWGQGSNGGWGQGHAAKKPSSKVGHVHKLCALQSLCSQYLCLIGFEDLSEQSFYCRISQVSVQSGSS